MTKFGSKKVKVVNCSVYNKTEVSWLRLAVVSGPLPGHSPTLARPCSVAAEFLNLDMCRPFSKLVKSGLFGDIAVCVVKNKRPGRWTATQQIGHTTAPLHPDECHGIMGGMSVFLRPKTPEDHEASDGVSV